MSNYIIHGVDRESEEDRTVTIEAESEDDAINQAADRNIIVSNVKRDSDPSSMPVTECSHDNVDSQEVTDVNVNEGGETLVDAYEKAYRYSLKTIDTRVKQLIKCGQEMEALILLALGKHAIGAIHEELHEKYLYFLLYQDVLKKFKSTRLKQLGYTLPVLSKTLEDAGSTDEDVEACLTLLHSLGFKKTHWALDATILTEIEFMISTLRILIHPDYLPFDDDTENTSQEDKPARHILSLVKMRVWQRDEGKCVECGSKEKLEYDHIIPVSKGGSNTERNVQLLCEQCNRRKSGNIQ